MSDEPSVETVDQEESVGVCHVCDEEVPVDGEQAIERFGEVLCRNCSQEPVVFRAVCEAAFCDWSYRVEETEWNRGHAKIRAQQEANHHENTKRVFDGEHVHKTEVNEVVTDGGRSADKVGHMPPVEEMPEVPVHRLEIAGEDGTQTRYVDSGYFDYGSIHLSNQYLIVCCGICGHDSKDWGAMKGHAWMGQEMHFSSRHVGAKIIWRAEDLPSPKAATHSLPSVRESRYNEDDNEWDTYEAKLRGDCPDDEAAEIARKRLEDGGQAELLIEHRPPAQPYPGSIEEGADVEVRPAPDNPPEAIA